MVSPLTTSLVESTGLNIYNTSTFSVSPLLSELSFTSVVLSTNQARRLNYEPHHYASLLWGRILDNAPNNLQFEYDFTTPGRRLVNATITQTGISVNSSIPGYLYLSLPPTNTLANSYVEIYQLSSLTDNQQPSNKPSTLGFSPTLPPSPTVLPTATILKGVVCPESYYVPANQTCNVVDGMVFPPVSKKTNIWLYFDAPSSQSLDSYQSTSISYDNHLECDHSTIEFNPANPHDYDVFLGQAQRIQLLAHARDLHASANLIRVISPSTNPVLSHNTNPHITITDSVISVPAAHGPTTGDYSAVYSNNLWTRIQAAGVAVVKRDNAGYPYQVSVPSPLPPGVEVIYNTNPQSNDTQNMFVVATIYGTLPPFSWVEPQNNNGLNGYWLFESTPVAIQIFNTNITSGDKNNGVSYTTPLILNGTVCSDTNFDFINRICSSNTPPSNGDDGGHGGSTLSRAQLILVIVGSIFTFCFILNLIRYIKGRNKDRRMQNFMKEALLNNKAVSEENAYASVNQ